MNTTTKKELDLEAFTPHKPELETLDLVRYWRSVNRYKWGILLLVIAVGLLAAMYASSLRPVYRGTAVVMVDGSRKPSTNEEMWAYWGASRDYFLTQYELLKSREYATKLVRAMGLAKHPDFDPRVQQPPWYADWIPSWAKDARDSLRETIPSTPAPAPRLSDAELEEAAIARVMGQTSVKPVRNTQIVHLSFDAHDPVVAERVPNALAMIYIVDDLESRSQISRRAVSFLTSQAEALKKKLEESERSLQQFREREKIVEAKGAPMTGAGRQLEALTLSLVDARQKRADAEALYAQIQAVRQTTQSPEALETLPAVLKQPAVQRLKDTEIEASKRVNEVSKRYGPEHPRMVSALAELRSAQESLRNRLESTIKTISKEYELAKANEETIERAIGKAKVEIQQQNRKEFELQSLEREVTNNRQLYEQFVLRAKQQRAGDMEMPVARIVDPAITPKGPVGPNKARIIGVAMLLALLAGVSLALLVERLDTRVKSSHEVETKLEIRSVGIVPRSPRGAEVAVERLYSEAGQTPFAEAVRSVRSALLLSALETRKQIVLVTSSIPEEGKSTLAGNLAQSLASVKKTLLLEADMRRPRFGTVFSEGANRPGLAEVVRDGVPLEECLFQAEDSELHLLLAGRHDTNPLALLSSAEFSSTMQKLVEQFDVIVIDSPPVQLVSDASVLAQMATSVLFVVKASSTPYPVARHALGRLRRVDAPLFGAILNQIDIEMADKYYGEHSGYGSKYYHKHGYHYARERVLS